MLSAMGAKWLPRTDLQSMLGTFAHTETQFRLVAYPLQLSLYMPIFPRIISTQRANFPRHLPLRSSCPDLAFGFGLAYHLNVGEAQRMFQFLKDLLSIKKPENNPLPAIEQKFPTLGMTSNCVHL